MTLRASVTDRTLDLPTLYRLVTLREAGDAFAHACRVAEREGAGTLVWTRRFDVAEFAVILEPEEALSTARRVFYLGMNALADALAAHAPPQRPISFDWPDAIRVDGVLVGGGRLGWPAVGEAEVPDWLVFSAIVRTAVMRAGEPGLRPLLGALDEVGFEAIEPGEILASFARHLMAGFHETEESGWEPVLHRYAERLATNSAFSSPLRGEAESARSAEPGEGAGAGVGSSPPHPVASRLDLSPLGRGSGPRVGLEESGNLAVETCGGPGEQRTLRDALLTPSWRNPQTGMPWL